MEHILLSLSANDSVPVPIGSMGTSMVPAAISFCAPWVLDRDGLSVMVPKIPSMMEIAYGYLGAPCSLFQGFVWMVSSLFL